MKLHTFLTVSLLLHVTVDCQDCSGNLITALQKCASSINGGDSLSLQQEMCAPDGCNYDCPSADTINNLNQQFQDISVTVQQLTSKVDGNAGNIEQLTSKVDGNADNIQQLQTSVDGNSGDISDIKGQQSDTSSMIQQMSSTLQQAQTNISNNMGEIATIKEKQSNTTSTVQGILAVQDTLLKTVANNSADIDILIEHIEHPCGSAGWTRVAYLDMSDPEQECPSQFMEYSANGKRACGRPTSNSGSCASITFATNMSYTEVCGKVIGYQKGTPQAINTGAGHNNLNSYYVDGVSITYGSPRQHIWTFMGSNKDHGNGVWTCPCNTGALISVQGFIGDDFFCESGFLGGEPVNSVLYTDDPLWDGENCRNKETPCCQIPGLPWFTKTLSTNTTADVELRVCGDERTANEDTPVSYYEIYVK